MPVIITHSTLADGTFSPAGATAWDANHTVSGLGTLADQNANNVNITGGAINDTAVGATSASSGAFTTLSASSTVSGTGFSTYLASPPAIGGTAPDAGTFTTLTGNSTSQFGRSSANYFQAIGAAANLTPEISVLGSDTNIPFTIKTKGTGAINLSAGSRGVNVANGQTVTAVTRTAVGTGYTSPPTVAISAPTTAGGVQATATSALTAVGASVTLASGGTGYTVGDVLTVSGGTSTTAATITVNTVSAGVIATFTVTVGGTYTVVPSNPVSVTGGTGSNATFNFVWGLSSTFTITNAGSGYVEQPTVTFSGGGGSGAAAYATVGSTPVVRSLGTNLSIFTPGGEQVRINDSAATSTAWVSLTGGSSTVTILADAASGNVDLRLDSRASGNVRLRTAGGTEQLRVTHTASAVNYVQVTGAATTARPAISAQGSDTNIDLTLTPKGTGAVRPGPVVLAAGTASASTAPLKFTSGTNLTTPEAGTREYDGVKWYGTTSETGSGRSVIDNFYVFYTTSAGLAIGPAIADLFVSAAFTMQTGATYVIEWHPIFTKTTAGTVVFTVVTSQTPQAVSVGFSNAQSALTASNAATGATTSTATPASASIANNAVMYMPVRAIVTANATTGGTVKLQVTSSAGTVTLARGSHIIVRRLPAANIGTFA